MTPLPIKSYPSWQVTFAWFPYCLPDEKSIAPFSMTMVGGQSMKEMFIKIQIKFPFRCKQFEIITRQNRWKIIQIYMDIYIEENT